MVGQACGSTRETSPIRQTAAIPANSALISQRRRSVRVAHRAEQREGEHIEQRAVIRVQPERGRVRPQRRGELPGVEQDERSQRHGERAAEAFERARGERRAQDQSQREDDRREAGGAWEEATRVERQVHDRRRREYQQGDEPNPPQRIALPRRDGGSRPGRRGLNRFARRRLPASSPLCGMRRGRRRYGKGPLVGRCSELLEGARVELLMITVRAAVRGVGARARRRAWPVACLRSMRAPLLAMPILVILLALPARLYGARLRALVLDGVAPVLSAVSVAAMTVALLDLLANGRVPSQTDWMKVWPFALIAVGAGRIGLVVCSARGASRRLVGPAGADHGRRCRRRAACPPVGASSRVRACSDRLLDDAPRSIAEVGGREMPVLGTVEDLDRDREQQVVETLMVAFSSVADARVSRLIQRC